MDENQRGTRNQDRFESKYQCHVGLLDMLRADDYYAPHEHPVSQQLPYPAPETAAYFLRSLMMDVMPENREPIPPFEDYQPEPMFCFFKGYTEQPQSQPQGVSYWSQPISLEMYNQRQHSSSQPMTLLHHRPESNMPNVKIEAQQLKYEEQFVQASRNQSDKPKKMMGGLSPEERQEKIARYLEKRRRRSFTKKVAYDCRKKVADQRIRVKGRFVTRKQALELLELPDGQYSEQRIKKLLIEKLSIKSGSQKMPD